jgi:general secretion pathway protein J
MSLVETLVALLLAGLIAWMGLAALGLAGRAGAAMAADPAAIAAVQEVLRLRLLGTLPATRPRAGGRPVLAFEGEARRLRFVAELPPRFGLPGPALVELSQREDALHLAWRPLGGGAGGGARVMLVGIAALALRYHGDPAGGREVAWRDTWRDAAQLPLAVEVGLLFPPGDPRRWPPLVVAPRQAPPP